jgi:hypothetical protein
MHSLKKIVRKQKPPASQNCRHFSKCYIILIKFETSEIELDCIYIGMWDSTTPLSTNVSTIFADKQRSLSRYSSPAD